MNGIKNKPANRQRMMGLNSSYHVAVYLFIIYMTVSVCGCVDPKVLEKETWILPCNYSGFVTVYFQPSRNHSDSSPQRTYYVNASGIAYSTLKLNEGFTENLNETMTIREQCNGVSQTISYYDNSVADTVRADVFATNLIVGTKNGYDYISIFIVRQDHNRVR